MRRDDVNAIRERLEEQLRADIELLYEAHRVKLRAFETVLRAQAELTPEADRSRAPVLTLPPPPRPAAPAETKAAAPAVSPAGGRAKAGAVYDAIADSFYRLPDVFDKEDVARILGYVPQRSTLYRILEDLVRAGEIAVEAPSFGRRPARYRKCAAAEPPGDAAEPAPAAAKPERTAEETPPDTKTAG